MDNNRKAGVVGYPISHSLSPKLHGFWLNKYNIAGEYKAYPVAPSELGEFIKKIRDDENFVGANFTIPHKEDVMKFIDEIDETAQKIGAVNTVVKKDKKLLGTNTDAFGFSKNIEKSLTGTKKAVVLGAGGAAKAVVFALKTLGFSEIIVTNRTKEKAEELISFGKEIYVCNWDKRSEILHDADLLVNTTALGMTGKEKLEIDLSLLSKTALITDIVYNPLITDLLATAQSRGNPVVDGLGMLLYQAVPGFESWFGVRPEVNGELRDYILITYP